MFNFIKKGISMTRNTLVVVESGIDYMITTAKVKELAIIAGLLGESVEERTLKAIIEQINIDFLVHKKIPEFELDGNTYIIGEYNLVVEKGILIKIFKDGIEL